MNLKDRLEQDLSITLSVEQERLFDLYLEILLETNHKMNLTAITDPHEVLIKHFYDSLLLAKVVDFRQGLAICDMGSGAGFPGIPLKIVFPMLRLTMIDSLTKRTRFLEILVGALGLADVTIINNRIEQAALNLQNTFDVVTARALGTMPLILEMGLPMVKKGGVLVAMKGAKADDELLAAEPAITFLGGMLETVSRHELPFDMGERTNIVIRKTAHVKGYPRPYAHMKKTPL